MADNVGYSPGSGATVATEDRSGIHFQKVIDATGMDAAGTSQQLSVTTGVISSLTVPANTLYAMIQCESNGVRWIDDGVTTVTTSRGMRLTAGQTMHYDGPLANFHMIAETATSVVNVNYYLPR